MKRSPSLPSKLYYQGVDLHDMPNPNSPSLPRLDLSLFFAKDRLGSLVASGIFDPQGSSAPPRGTKPLSPRTLSAYATYIIRGKDEKGLSPIDRKLITDDERRYASYLRKNTTSLEAVMEANPYTAVSPVSRSTYKKCRPHIDRELDKDVPFLADLWDTIDRTEQLLAAAIANGDNARAYHLRHHLITMRGDQYLLKEAYRPTTRWAAPLPSPTVPPNIADHLDEENPLHLRAILDLYSKLLMENWEKPDTYARAILFDFDRLVDETEFSPSRLLIIVRHVDGWSLSRIAEDLRNELGIEYSENRIGKILNEEIPKKLAETATRRRLLSTTPPSQRAKCRCCGEALPLLPLFFTRNSARSSGFSATCKACDKAKRIREGKQQAVDGRKAENRVPKKNAEKGAEK